MDERGPSPVGRQRRASGQPSNRPGARRGGYASTRGEHRQPVRSGNQARRDNRQAPYIVGFVVVVGALAAFLYVGLNWATGPGRAAALATLPTPTSGPIVAAPTPPAVPTNPTVAEQTYTVKAGDSPTSIAQQFRVKVDDLMSVNDIKDPSKLQIGQVLRIPPPPGAP